MNRPATVFVAVCAAALCVAAASPVVADPSPHSSAPSAVSTQSIEGVMVRGLPSMRSLAQLENHVAANSTQITVDARTGDLLEVDASAAPGGSAPGNFGQIY
ncbi:hypothetical protein EDF46_1986 [Frondihabitans sp. PhB188]|uniref:hypothetical protein n=1 Tax=Frondihabitans sp. PhB188 TaxID=2485200 RepID=UPI000FB79720|nr:hypothetical protein [Frondihabitans sp. PhB188]ROQ38352.1 hypothetical protein EDF46_1986 [Frondihabitans sp. PhB188]